MAVSGMEIPRRTRYIGWTEGFPYGSRDGSHEVVPG